MTTMFKYQPILLLIAALALWAGLWFWQPVSAIAIGSTIDCYPLYLANDGATPIVAHVTFTGLNENTTYYYKLKYSTVSGWTWNPGSSSWIANSTPNANYTNFPSFTTGAGQTSYSLWIYMHSAGGSPLPGAQTMKAGVAVDSEGFNYGTEVTINIVDVSPSCSSVGFVQL